MLATSAGPLSTTISRWTLRVGAQAEERFRKPPIHPLSGGSIGGSNTQGWLRPAADGSGTNVLICDSRGMPVDVREGRRYNKSLFDKVKDVFSVGWLQKRPSFVRQPGER